MAKSKARKLRDHIARNGSRNPADSRADQPDFSTHTRRTPTRQDKIHKREQKHKKRSIDCAS